MPIAQAALSAGLSWLVAVHVVGHRSPFFAPIAAVICLGVTLSLRLRRGIELVVGVSIGVAVGDLLISALGTGPWQIALAVALAVALAMSVAVLVDGGPVITIQSAASAVLVATLYLPDQTSGVSRMVDTLIGGGVALVVAALLPANPLTVAHRNAGRVLRELAIALHGVARAIKEGDRDKAAAVLSRARDTQRIVDDFRTALQAGKEIVTIAPFRWHRRPELERYLTLMTPVDHALRNTRVLIRRVVAALRDGEVIPDALYQALDKLADAVELLCTELGAGKEPVESRRRMQIVAMLASAELIGDGGFSAGVVLAQLRSIVVDMLQATGMTMDNALAALPALNRRKEVS